MAQGGAHENRNIWKAVRNAILIWIVLYFVVIHCFVIWNWDSDISVPDDIVLNETIPWYETEEHKQDMERLEATISAVEKELFNTQALQNKMTVLIRKIKKAKENLQRAKEPAKIVLFRDMKKQQKRNPILRNVHEPSRLIDLLEVANLRETYPMDTALRQVFRVALKDIAKNIEMADSIDWSVLRKILQDDLRVPERTLAPAAPCPTAGTAATTIGNTAAAVAQDLYADAVRVEEMQKHMNQVRNELNKRRGGGGGMHDALPVSFPETVARLEEMRNQAAAQIAAKRAEIVARFEQGQQQQTTTTTTQESKQCLQAQQVLPWLEAGLDSIYRGKDPRQGMTRAFREDSTVDTTGIILDAALPEATDDSKTPISRKKTRKTLRQWLNTPLTQDLGTLINYGIDSASGYNDPLDQYLDELAKKHPDLGEAAVQTLLKAAGSIPIPEVLLPRDE